MGTRTLLCSTHKLLISECFRILAHFKGGKKQGQINYHHGNSMFVCALQHKNFDKLSFTAQSSNYSLRCYSYDRTSSHTHHIAHVWCGNHLRVGLTSFSSNQITSVGTVQECSGTSLLWTLSGPHEVSRLKRCPYFRGCFVHFSV